AASACLVRCGREPMHSALLRRYIPDRGREHRMGRRVHRPVLDLRARRILAEGVVVLPVLRRPDWSGGKPNAAVGTNVTQHVLDARSTEGALVGADPRLQGVGRERLVAMLAGGPQRKQ